MSQIPDRGEVLGNALGITEDTIRKIGEFHGANVYYDPYIDKTHVMVMFGPIEEDPNMGRLIHLGSGYADGKPHIEFDNRTCVKAIICGIKVMDCFDKTIENQTLEHVTERNAVWKV